MLNRAVLAGTGIFCFIAPLSSLAESAFFDRQLALDLAAAHVRYALRGKLGHEFGEANFRKPFYREATVSGGRTFVFIAYPSLKTSDAAFATLQYCDKTALLVAAEVGITSSFDAYRQSTLGVSRRTQVALPNVCPVE